MSDLDQQYEFMSKELRRICIVEESKRKHYHANRQDLQEIWDKLVSLRTHINRFTSEIENVKIEEIVQDFENKQSSQSLNESTLGLSIESAGRLADVHFLREKIRLKEALKGRVALIEESLAELRRQLLIYSDAIKLGSDWYQSKLNNDAEMSTGKYLKTSSTMEIRRALLDTSENINILEVELSNVTYELKIAEENLSKMLMNTTASEISAYGRSKPFSNDAVLWDKSNISPGIYNSPHKKHIHNNSSPASSSMIDIVTQGPAFSNDLADALRYGIEGNDQFLSNKRHKPNPSMTTTASPASTLECEFSLHEVLSGQAAIVRMNGEKPRSYAMRLERRLSSFIVLEEQLQGEFTAKIEAVKHLHTEVRDDSSNNNNIVI